MWKARIFTLYPEIFPGPLNKGLYGKALSNKIWNLDIINIRDSARDKHKTVDDTPFGGGSGMLIKPDVLASSIDHHVHKSEKTFYGTIAFEDGNIEITDDVILEVRIEYPENSNYYTLQDALARNYNGSDSDWNFPRWEKIKFSSILTSFRILSLPIILSA